ncbi:MAG: phage tail sheath family protein, partial [Gammaproteobacteria bacterium]|nr:phage tail sheath family protein [Gammaproteobacteria bacterium]
SVQQFFQNGGSDALIVRVQNGGSAATLVLPVDFQLVAASNGDWGEGLRVRVDHETRDPTDNTLFNLTIRDTGSGVTERFLNLSTDTDNARFVTDVLAFQSKLIRTTGAIPVIGPTAHGDPPAGVDPMLDDISSTLFNADGDDGIDITDNNISLASLEIVKQGIWALEKADIFNLLCIPPLTRAIGGDVNSTTRNAAAKYCEERRAVYVVDPLTSWDLASDLTDSGGLESVGWGMSRSTNAALYFPRIKLPDPLQENRLAEFAPCGAVAGVMARTDSQRGVWKAPAGNDATLNGVVELTVKLTDGENGQLNPLAVNCLRAFPVTGRVVWGARTLRGADQLASEWKYLPVRRLALFIEESLFRGTQWVVFEPNDEPLWAQIRLNLGAFMHNLFRQGAFQGSSPREAYFVKCDGETTTQNDIDQGIVNIVVGFAPLKPAEFVVIKIQQIAGQIQA